ncbi:MAG TPA: precorrin-6y C5,15-methyltransferase (decarboxylating) subunit CbiE [Polyangiaceae bacterium]|nr:precorrin-6y C5,15-methyltransferase (decarboxylating) subunit CbiE [Polyangiaceae bacterium]
MSFDPTATPEPDDAPDPILGGARPDPTRGSWLTLVGIGADGVEGLSPAARAALERAELVFGSARQLSLLQGIVSCDTAFWPTRFSLGLARVLSRRGQPTVVLSTGDPFFFGVGATLAPHLTPGEFICYPVPSSLSLAASRLGWALQDTEVVSLHGRDLRTIVRYLHPGRRVLALSWNQDTPAELARLLMARGFGPTRLTVLEALGGPEERVRSCLASDFDLSRCLDLNVVGLDLAIAPHAIWVPVRASLPDSEFEHDGQLTKQDIRAVTLSALRPRPGALLWDVGAGSGSIGIEWLLSHPACRAVAIEQEPARCERIRRNAHALGVSQLQVVEGSAPDALRSLEAPDAVFLGGGAADPDVLEQCWSALEPGGWLVANAVSLETEARLLAAHAAQGGDLRRLSIESAAPLGTMTGWRPALPVMQWRIQKQ